MVNDSYQGQLIKIEDFLVNNQKGIFGNLQSSIISIKEFWFQKKQVGNDKNQVADFMFSPNLIHAFSFKENIGKISSIKKLKESN